MTQTDWQLQEAKARLSELVKSAERGPQQITVHGRPAAVVLSRADYDRLVGVKPSFVTFMRQSPLMGVSLDVVRAKSPARDVSL